MPINAVISIAGHDPSTGAGSIAHVETIRQLGLTPLSCISSVTSQDTQNIQTIYSLSASALEAQYQVICADISPSHGVLGLIGSVELANQCVELIDNSHIPWVIDPVLKASGGTTTSTNEITRIYQQALLPRAHLITPNVAEAQQLLETDNNDPKTLACALLSLGTKAALVTTSDSDNAATITHHLATQQGLTKCFDIERLPGSYHGTGCTLAAAIASYLALGESLESACQLANQYTYQSLLHAFSPGHGASIPNRGKP